MEDPFSHVCIRPGNYLRSSPENLTEPTTHVGSPIISTHPHGYSFFIKFYPYGIGPASEENAFMRFTLFPGDFDSLLRWPFAKRNHVSIRDQFDPPNSWVQTIHPDDNDPAFI